jgi:hypothetical protein
MQIAPGIIKADYEVLSDLTGGLFDASASGLEEGAMQNPQERR